MNRIPSNLGFSRHLIVAFLLAVIVIVPLQYVYPSRAQRGEFNYLPIVDQARKDFMLIKELTLNLSNMGSRFTGYPGYYRAASFIEEWFNRYLDEVEVQEYNLTVICDYGATLTLDNGDKINVYPLIPNEAAFVYCENLEGQLIYVGSGDWKNLDGKKIKDAIVILDFNSNLKWLNLAKLGAKAVIFLENPYASRKQAMMKYLENIPYSFPRFYMKMDDFMKISPRILKGESITASLTGKTRWENKKAVNIIGVLKGSGRFPNQAVLLSAYFDSFSVVPSISPGASEAISPSILLALAKWWGELPRDQRPDYDIIFVAFSGHNQGLWGAREWVEKYVYGPYNPANSPYHRDETIANYVKLAIQIDVWPDSPLIYPGGLTGGFYHNRLITAGMFGTNIQIFLMNEYENLKKQTNKDYKLMVSPDFFLNSFSGWTSDIVFWTNIDRWADLEVLAIQGCPVIFMSTAKGLMVHYSTPTDTYENIEDLLPNVQNQMEILYAWLHGLLHTDYISKLSWGANLASERLIRYAHAEIEVVTWNFSRGWYDPLPRYVENQTVIISWYGAGETGGAGFSGYKWRAQSRILASEDGKAKVIGLTAFRTEYQSNPGTFHVTILDSKGRVIAVRDLGEYGLKEFPMSLARGFPTLDVPVKIPVFKCASIMIFDYVAEGYLDRTAPPMIKTKTIIGHTDLVQHAEIAEYRNFGISLLMAFVETGKPIEVIITSGRGFNLPIVVLANKSYSNPEGSGYNLTMGQQIQFSIFDYAKNLHIINLEREKIVTGLFPNIEKTDVLIEKMNDALEKYEYSRAYNYAVEAWACSLKAYNSLRSTIEDAVYTIPFFCAFVIPFAILFEMFVFGATGTRRLVIVLITCFAIIAAYSVFHPGFRLASSVMIIIIDFAILALVLPAFGIIINQVRSMFKDIRRRILGEEFETTPAGVLLSSISTGVGYMKKRRFRSLLMLFSIIIMVLALILFTSASNITYITPIERTPTTEPAYEGILIDSFPVGSLGIYGISGGLIDYIQTKYSNSALICPRVWMWPAHGAVESESAGFIISSIEEKEVNCKLVRGIIALSPEEDELTHIDLSLIGGRWFVSEEKYAVILPDFIAEELGIPLDLPETVKISLSGLELSVVGIIDSTSFGLMRMMNGMAFTPIDMTRGYPVQLPVEFTIIVPYSLWPEVVAHYQAGSSVNAMIISLGIKFIEQIDVMEKAKELFSDILAFTELQMWIYQGGTLSIISSKSSIKTTGFTEQIVPMAIVAFTMLNIMIGNVYERKRDILVFSSLGLSPSHVTLLFLAESIVVGILGCLLGYLTAVSIMYILTTIKVSTAILNYTSGWIALSMSITFLVTLLSTLYPAYLASRMVTPSLQRTWSLPTKPRGTEWEIPLPFLISSKKDVERIMKDLENYLRQHQSVSAPDFQTDAKITLRETEGAVILNTIVRLKPFELGVRQKVQIESRPVDGKWNLIIHLTRITGYAEDWQTLNRRFLDLLRKRVLVVTGSFKTIV